MDHLLHVFIEETEGRLARLAEAVAAGDRAAIAQIAHGLRSAAGTIGTLALAEAARAVEPASALPAAGQDAGSGGAVAAAYAPIQDLAAASLTALRRLGAKAAVAHAAPAP